MRNLVIFSVDDLYKLIHDEPVFDEKSNTLYMSRDCYEMGIIAIKNSIWA